MTETLNAHEGLAFDALSFSQSGFEIQPRFPTPFLVAPVNEAAELKPHLSKTILAHAARMSGVARSNAGGWQSDADFADWGGPAAEVLLTAACHLATLFTAVETDGGLLEGAPAWRVNAWANINGPGDANRPHHHPAAFWSGVYWVDDGAGDEDIDVGGEFEMQDPRGILPAFYAPRLRYAVPGGLTAGREDFFTPRAGVLVMFPSWLVHAVRPYVGTRTRISIAFNLSV